MSVWKKVFNTANNLIATRKKKPNKKQEATIRIAQWLYRSIAHVIVGDIDIVTPSDRQAEKYKHYLAWDGNQFGLAGSIFFLRYTGSFRQAEDSHPARVPFFSFFFTLAFVNILHIEH